jgi:hypothetical protein
MKFRKMIRHMKVVFIGFAVTLWPALVAVGGVSAHEIIVPTRVYYLTAGQLEPKLEQAIGYGPGLRPTIESTIEGHEAMSFVDGVTDAVQGTIACTTPQQRTKVLSLAGAYLRGHPDRRSEPAAKVVIDALKMHFPCPVRQTRKR